MDSEVEQNSQVIFDAGHRRGRNGAPEAIKALFGDRANRIDEDVAAIGEPTFGRVDLDVQGDTPAGAREREHHHQIGWPMIEGVR